MLLLLLVLTSQINAIEISNLQTSITTQGGLLIITNDIETDQSSSDFVTCYPEDYSVSLAHLNDQTILKKSAGEFKNKNCFDVLTKQKKFKITAFVTNSLVPSPKAIGQLDRQTLLLRVNKFLYSPYKVNKQTTRIAGEFVEHDLPDSSDKKGLLFGPFYETEPFSEEIISFLMNSNDPLISLPNYKRQIEISHWGLINVREFVHIQSNSAKILNEAFSRLDYSHKAQQAPSVEQIIVEIPLPAQRIYFRDDIGNISTSQIHANTENPLKSKILALFFRFPLVSGWRTQIEFGYQIPAQQYIRYIDGEYIFSSDFISLLYNNQVVDNYELEIVLPPYATDVELKSVPSNIKSTHFGAFSSFLDIAADRKTVVIKCSNLIPLHQSVIKVGYRHSTVMLMVKPIVLSAMFLLVFLTIIVMERMDFSILPLDKSGFDVHYSANKLGSAYGDFVSFCSSAQERINDFKRTKNEAAFEPFRLQFDEQFRSIKKSSTNIEEELENSQGSDKMRAIIKDVLTNSQEIRTQIVQLNGKFQQIFVNATKLVGGSMSAADYTAFELKNISDRADIVDKVEELINNL